MKAALWAIFAAVLLLVGVTVWTHFDTSNVYSHSVCTNNYDSSGRAASWSCTASR